MPITTPKVPDGLPELMRGLAKSVIKENPENIYVHAAEYFENLIRERDGDLDKGYGSFSAYKVYSDYKDKCREKGGSGSSAGGGVPAKAISDGDDDDSGGSASAKGRGKRRKRVRKQGSKDSGKSVDKEDVPGSASSGGAGENLSSIKEDAPPTEKTVEEEPVKVETRKEVQTALSKAISIDSEAAANAVSTVLEDTVLDSDEAVLEEEAEWENLKQPINCEDLSSYPAEEFGSAPSTAEVVGEVTGDGENLVEDAPSSEKNSDEVDLTVSEKAEVAEEPVVNGSVELESPKKVSEEQPEPPEGIDTVDAEDGNAIAPRMGSEDDVPDMPDVPTEEPEAGTEEAEVKEESGDNPSESVEPQPEEQQSSTEKNADEEQNSGSSSPKKSDEQVSEPVHEESQSEAGQAEEIVEKSVEESAAEFETKESSQEQAEPESDEPPKELEEVQQDDDAAASEVSSPKKPASMDENPKSDAAESTSPEKSGSVEAVEEPTGNQESDPAAESTSPVKSASVEVVEEPTENQESDPVAESTSPAKSGSVEAAEEPTKNQESDPAVENTSPVKLASVEAVEEPTENQESDPAVENTSPVKSGSVEAAEEPKENQESDPAAESTSPTKSASVEAQEEPTENQEPSDENQKSGSASPQKSASVEAASEPVEGPPSNGDDQPASESPRKSASLEQEDAPSASPEKPDSVDAAAESDPGKQEEEQACEEQSVSEEQPAQEEKEASSSPRKSASIDEASNKPASDGAAESSGGSSPKKSSASLEEQENEAEEEPQTDDPSATKSKESSLEKTTESDPNGAGDDGEPSKESSAKESEGDDATKGDAEEAEMSIGSRMGAEDDEQAEEPQEPSAPPSEQASDGMNEESKNGEENEEGSKQNSMDDENKEEAVEEPCIQRQVSPSASKPPSKHQSTDLEEIKKVDLASFNKDSAEALFYSLKKTELQNDEPAKKDEGEEDDDDADVVVGVEEPPAPISRQLSKRSFTDDFLEKGPITEEAPKQAEGDGVQAGEDGEQFNPMAAATVRSVQLQEQMHARDDTELVGSTQRKTPIRRSMTERVDLVRQDSNYVDLRKYDPDYVQEEDDFDGYYIGNIKNKILASSVSVADSDDFDPRQSQEVIDDNNVRTALETIASTDTESTLPSQITVQANRGFLKNTSSNIPYASFGNNAIDQSLDEFIEREEQNKEAEEQAAASKIQRSYRQFRSNKKKLLRDYHSTMQTCTEDQSTESLEEYPNNIIKIKVDQKHPEAQEGEESENNSIEDGRAENRRRPMYSLNIDEYDTAARRMTLTRGVAMQRTSTPEEDSGKSSDNTSGKPQPSSEPETKLAEGSTISTSGPSSTEDKKEGSSSDEKENKDTGSSKSNEGSEKGKARPLSDSRKYVSLDAQKLFLARQRTMPVQIDASVIRVLPKHMRKRNKSAGMVRK